jgi:hypothetical protein
MVGRRRLTGLMAAVVALLLVPAVAAADPGFTPGSDGVGDPYYPLDGNGGYDVDRYDLDLHYDPASDVLSGTATITARATQNLSAFNLDLVGLTVQSVTVNGRDATWSRAGQELTIVPARGIARRSRFTVAVRYEGVPEPTVDSLGESGFLATDDGNVLAGEPHGAATWFPANDHPTDPASFSFKIAVPAGLEAVANGRLKGQRTRNGWTTWEWEADDPMATYLATMNTGEFEIDAYRRNGIRYWDAIDPDLLAPLAEPTSGTRLLLSGQADSSWKRLTRTITVGDGGATVGFTVNRATEAGWDFLFVEAHTVGQGDWTTLEDANGHTAQDTGQSCPAGWQQYHPFMASYQTVNPDQISCSPSGTTGAWWAATGSSDGPEQWQVTIPGPARTVEVAISYASDNFIQAPGVFLDDIVVSTGEGTTSFEDDGDPLDGWTVAGPPPGSPGNDTDWSTGGAADVPPAPGEIAREAFARQPEIIDFLSGAFGRYPWSIGGGIVDDGPLGFALETQTRPIYSSGFFGEPVGAASVVVHELAHQWYGNSLTLERWRDIWLNEGFATYAEWLWSEREGLGTAQETFDFVTLGTPPDDLFWTVVIGDPGAGNEFNGAVYTRGAMTLHALRLAVGDEAFFRILRRWASSQAGDTVTTEEFIALAERVSGQQLDSLFQAWLYTPSRPELPTSPAGAAALEAPMTVAARNALEP